jgi:hypothetical protein
MQTFLAILAAILSLIALVASLILIRGLAPARVEKISQTLENSWKRSFWIGLLNTILITIFVIGLGALGQSNQVFLLPTFAVYGAFLIGLLFGLSAFIGTLGERLFPELHPVKRDIRAGAIFILGSLLPVVGWFLLFPYGLSLAVGAVVITIFQERRSRKNLSESE